MLMDMGFPRVRCVKAVLATQNADQATNWIMEHMDDPDIDVEPAPQQPAPSSKPEPSPENVALLMDMGFSRGHSRKALRETVALFLFISCLFLILAR